MKTHSHASRASVSSPTAELFHRLEPGDLVLVGGRPGQGKTLVSLELAVEAMKAGKRSIFFTLEYTEKDVWERFRKTGVEQASFGSLFEFDNSDDICADYIVGRLSAARPGTLVVIDYLQLLDQKRANPGLNEQVHRLQSFARERGVIVLFISQIDRSYDASLKAFPDLEDIRLPNPLDLAVFTKTCFVQRGEVRFGVH